MGKNWRGYRSTNCFPNADILDYIPDYNNEYTLVCKRCEDPPSSDNFERLYLRIN